MVFCLETLLCKKEDNIEHDSKYFKNELEFPLNREYEVEKMTKLEYFNKCMEIQKYKKGLSKYIKDSISLTQFKEYHEAINNGDKFPLPYIDSNSQEGRHRILATLNFSNLDNINYEDIIAELKEDEELIPVVILK
jgi:hypothetical protein